MSHNSDTATGVNVSSAPDAYARPLPDLLREIDLPASTYHAIRTRGEGPKTFRLGRRVYVRAEDWTAWLDDMAAKAGNKEGQQ